MRVTVNGVCRELAGEVKLGEVLRELSIPAAGIAVAVNERVVSRGSIADYRLVEGDVVEIIRAVAGG